MISFKRVTKNDISMIVSWIKQPHVLKWWYSAQNKTEQEVYLKYLNRLEDSSIQMYISYYNDIPIGYLQAYYISDEMKHLYTINNGVGTDLFLGNIDFLGIGLGKKMLHDFISNIIFKEFETKYICIDPVLKNKKAIHVYESVQFKHVKTRVDEHSKELTYYMLLCRKDFFDFFS
jgi:hypothetical protein